MTQANINDRTTVERVYPRDAFEVDIRANARAKDPVQRGVRIASAPDQDGNFDLAQASRHTGELAGGGDTVFVAPFETFDAALTRQATDYGAPLEVGDELGAIQRSADAYNAFIDRVVETAKTAEFEPPIGRNAEVLQGFHGG